jgi:hypothetical protein
MRLLTAAAEGTTTKTNHLGTLLLLKHTVDLLTHDLACRTRVFRGKPSRGVQRCKKLRIGHRGGRTMALERRTNPRLFASYV